MLRGRIARVDYKNPYATEIIADHLASFLTAIKADPYSLTCICIGTPRSAGDSLGPRVGSIIKREVSTIGCVEYPLHALNMSDYISDILLLDYTKKIVVDACLGSRIGRINIGLGPLIPGMGVGKILPSLGDIFIQGVVMQNYKDATLNSLYLGRVSLDFINEMVVIISEGILLAIKQLIYKREVNRYVVDMYR